MLACEEQTIILQNHFSSFYALLAEQKFIPSASYETFSGLQRCLSGIPIAVYNAVIGCPQQDWDACILEQLKFFQQAHMPFVWYVDENSPYAFKQKLIQNGFQDGGIFQGVIGNLANPFPMAALPAGYTLENVQEEHTLRQFNEHVCDIFEIGEPAKSQYASLLWKYAQGHHPMFSHWLIRKDGQVISALTTLILRSMVSFWNGSTLPEARCQGLSTAIRYAALNNAISRGCTMGASYLMSTALALGICNKIGYKTQWRFHAFFAPEPTTVAQNFSFT